MLLTALAFLKDRLQVNSDSTLPQTAPFRQNAAWGEIAKKFQNYVHLVKGGIKMLPNALTFKLPPASIRTPLPTPSHQLSQNTHHPSCPRLL